MTLVRIVKDWDWPDLLRQTPGQKGVWNGIRFTLEEREECDYLVMLNNRMKTRTKVTCPPQNIWVLMQEPYEKGFSDWMVEGHDRFSKVLTHHIPADDPKYVTSHPAIPWHVNRTFDQLTSCPVPGKVKSLSWVIGDAMDLPGHLRRWSFLEAIRRVSLPIDVFGKKIHYLEDKWDGLAPYRYALAIENNSGPDMWTEKLADCFLTWTLPFYYGCTNLEDYFPEESFVRIDITQPEAGLEKIRAVMAEDVWEKRLPALEEARNLVLHRYQIFPHLAKLISAFPEGSAEKMNVTIPPYRRSAEALWRRTGYKLKKKFRRLET
ncbi:MAG: glycosyltransferase family 10 [Candidatus Omnitrophica bacterium]|nr:glycosyltransferase family 10 [Candidatus Omnitrophota bacterium]